MANLTECPDCEKFFVGDACECGYRVLRSNVIQGPWQRPAWMNQTRACTEEENYRAAENVQAVLDGVISVHQAHVVLNAIFHGRELEGNTCACGMRMRYAGQPV